jgi:hypothetical protein
MNAQDDEVVDDEHIRNLHPMRPAAAPVRNAGPITSALANPSRDYVPVVEVLAAFPNGATHEQLVAKYLHLAGKGTVPAMSEQGVRSRCAEAVRDGFAAATGRYATTRAGRRSTIWQAIRDTPAGDEYRPALAEYRPAVSADRADRAVVTAALAEARAALARCR